MRTTVVLDDQLLADAQEFTGIKERTQVLNEALRALVSRESARRLAKMGGIDPKASAARRRRSPSAE